MAQFVRRPVGRLLPALSLLSRFGFAAELSGQSHDDVQPRGVFVLGTLVYKAGPRLVCDAGLRFGLDHSAPRVGAFAGLTLGVGKVRE